MISAYVLIPFRAILWWIVTINGFNCTLYSRACRSGSLENGKEYYSTATIYQNSQWQRTFGAITCAVGGVTNTASIISLTQAITHF